MVLGIAAGFHDAAAALVDDGVVLAAVEQERLSRVKHDPSFPAEAIAVCLAVAGREPAEIDLVVHHERPVAVLDRYMATRLQVGPRALRALVVDTPRVVRGQLGVPGRIAAWFVDRGVRVPAIDYVDHHVSHAAAAFFPSPFRDAAILTVDGVGEWATATRGSGHGRHLSIDDEIMYPSSLGLLYSAFTEYCGFRADGGEGELMGLAPYGEPRFVDRILTDLMTVGDDGGFELRQRFFAFTRGRRMVSRRFERTFGGPARPVGSAPTQREADLAASVQAAVEHVLLRMAIGLRERSGVGNLCLAGGVALNCVANGRLLRSSGFDDVWVQPAPGDAGSAVGAALWACHSSGSARTVEVPDGMCGAFLGPSFSTDEISGRLDELGVVHRRIGRGERDDVVADRLAEGAVVGWFQGRMEFGPRALGHRSILADPRSVEVKGRINEMVKERALFRPFAPAVLVEHVAEWFVDGRESPYMSFVQPVRLDSDAVPSAGRSDGIDERAATPLGPLPAITHVDGSARLQTVDDHRNGEFASLLRAFHRRTGCPLLLNTSFNARDEPIVCTPDDALATFRRTHLDLLVMEDVIVEAA